ncbi:MAG: FdtA/QdtA family cupin domain-containing protein [Muribaculaceae bacterium]|nr:FdtA/QdtA family cupin domain-containing protein [Muribaculaceae bacterium]
MLNIKKCRPVSADSHRVSSIADCRVIDLDRHRHDNGSLSVVENTRQFPFELKRVFYLYDVPGDSERGGHSHHCAEELMVAVSGSFDVTLTDGRRTEVFTLNRPYRALYIPAGIWRSIDNFSSGSVCLVLTSELFSEDDYVRDFDRFLQLTAEKLQR